MLSPRERSAASSPATSRWDGSRPAIRGDLVGVDLLPTTSAYIVSEVNGAGDFRPSYGLGPEGVYVDVVLELLRVARVRAATRTVSA